MKVYKRKILTKTQSVISREKALVLQGARRTGKTTILLYLQDLLERQGKRTVYYNLTYPDVLAGLARGRAALTDDLTAKGYGSDEVFVFLDDLQQLKNLSWLNDLPGHVHLIAAAAIKLDLPQGIKTMEVLPLTFSEFLEFKTAESSGPGQWPVLYQEFVRYGGYPEIVLEPLLEKKKQLLWQLIDIYLRKDIGNLAKINDLDKFYCLLKVLAGQAGQTLDMMAVCRETGTSFPTLQKYLAVLEQTFLVERVKPYGKRATAEISKSPKLFFLDSGLQSILWLQQFQPMILEPVFKTNIFGELVKKLGREAVKFWRTKAGAEVDFIVEKPGGNQPDGRQVLAIEAAINFQRFNQKNMSSFKRRYNPKRWRLIGLEGEKLVKNGFYPWEM